MIIIDLDLFKNMFPCYSNYMVPMWSEWEEGEKEAIFEVAVPGYTKEDFSLYVEDGMLMFDIQTNKQPLSYSILGKPSSKKFNFEAAKAEYVNGVLKVIIPKFSEKKPKKIQLRVS